jgi:hypothetical protein
LFRILLDESCRDHLCQNEGTCVAGGPGNYSCSCLHPYRGRYCEQGPDIAMMYQSTSPCSHHDCQHGHCQVRGGGVFSCSYLHPYRGRYGDQGPDTVTQGSREEKNDTISIASDGNEVSGTVLILRILFWIPATSNNCKREKWRWIRLCYFWMRGVLFVLIVCCSTPS